jgi:hypothetical protein
VQWRIFAIVGAHQPKNALQPPELRRTAGAVRDVGAGLRSFSRRQAAFGQIDKVNERDVIRCTTHDFTFVGLAAHYFQYNRAPSIIKNTLKPKFV